MKKAALTIGLFSLAMVATSFTTPQIISSTVSIDGRGGQQGLDRSKKSDVYNTSNQSSSIDGQLNSFASDSQSTRSKIKVD